MQSIPKIKICGITTLEEIRIINQYDVDYVGFVFAKSKRQVNKEHAINLIKKLNKNIKTVGVFVNANLDEINFIVKYCSLDIVQLHGDESIEYCQKVCTKVWKSVSVKNLEDIKRVDKYENSVDGILLDTYVKGQQGGTGKVFNWHYAENISNKHFIILAGGITIDNVLKAIKIVRPNVVDISSGVELNGKKDKNKVEQFVRRVKKDEYK